MLASEAGQREDKPQRESEWHTLQIDVTLQKLGARLEGLSGSEVAVRLHTFGPNELREAKAVRPWIIFTRQFKSLLILLLLIAAGISLVVGEWIDAVAIMAIVFLNAGIGFYQEFSAEKSIAALKQMTAPRATVRREGQARVVPASQIVEGDILLLDSGDLVAADARLLEANSLKCVEAALTGESQPIEKHTEVFEQAELSIGDRANMVFLGTHVAVGTGTAVVVATGMRTEVGRIASLLAEASGSETTPLQERLHRFGRVLAIAALCIVGAVFALGLVRGMEPLHLFMTAISLAVAAVPEGLPAIVTVALALGVMRMANRQALIRRLPAVETLGSTSVICTDKTGTLTVGEMTVRELYVAGESFRVTGEGYGPEGEVVFGDQTVSRAQAQHLLELANVMIASNNASLALEEHGWKVVGDPTEGALLAAGHKAGARRDRIENEFRKRHEIPFDSERKRRTVLRLLPDGRLRAFVNGAPDVLLEHCTQIYTEEGIRSLTTDDRRNLATVNAEMAQRALRVLGSAYRDFAQGSPESLDARVVEHNLVFVGLAGMYDPPRPSAGAAVRICKGAGIRVVMITGDHPQTALAIAQELGIAEKDGVVLSGNDLQRLSDPELEARVESVSVFARVSAEHKLRIIRAWKARDSVVAMTGDGVNDAPAIKGADIGVAMGRSGTEVTKQAADMIITDDNFASIVAAVEEGRGIFNNIRKTLQFLLASNAGELLLMAAAVVLGLPLPLLPLHLLWVNLITDGPPALALAAEPIGKHLMRQPPRRKNQDIGGRGFGGTVLLTGFATAAVAVGVFYFNIQASGVEMARTLTFATLVFSQLLLALGFRSTTLPCWENLFKGKVVVTIFSSLLLQAAIFKTGFAASILKCEVLPIQTLLWIIPVSAVPLLCLEVMKAVNRMSNRNLG